MSTATDPAPPPVVERPARRGTAAIVGLGVALLGAAALVSAVYARQDDDLDWSVYVIGLGVTAAMVLVMLVGSVGRDLEAKRALTGFPGAVGAISAGVMVGVGLEDESWVQWAVGGVILGIAVVAFLLGRAGAPTVAAVAGLAVLYGKAVEEFVDPSEDNQLIVGGAVVVVFVVGVTAIGWVLPHRALVGVVAGVFGVVGIAGLLGTATIAAQFSGAMSSLPGGEPTSGPGDLENDVYVFLAYSAGLVLLWTLAAWATGSSGFRVLAVVHSAVIVPLAMVILVVEHPTWWGAALAVAGGVVLLLALVAGRRAHQQAAPPPGDTEPPEPFFGRPAPPPTPADGTDSDRPVDSSRDRVDSSGDGTRDSSGDRTGDGTGDRSSDTVIAPADAPPPPDPNDRRPS